MRVFLVIILVIIISEAAITESKLVHGLPTSIFRVPRKTLEAWTLAVEKYLIQEKQLKLDGKMIEVLQSLMNNAIIDFILGYSTLYPELNSVDKLDELSSEYSLLSVDEYIGRRDRETLIKWAYAAERFDYKLNDKTYDKDEGIHTYIDRSENYEITDYILREITEHPEIANYKKLNYIVSPFDDIYAKDGGLFEYIFIIPVPKLRIWALACERYHREVKNIHISRMSDYINEIETEDIVDYILKMANMYNVLNSGKKLDIIASEYELLK